MKKVTSDDAIFFPVTSKRSDEIPVVISSGFRSEEVNRVCLPAARHCRRERLGV